MLLALTLALAAQAARPAPAPAYCARPKQAICRGIAPANTFIAATKRGIHSRLALPYAEMDRALKRLDKLGPAARNQAKDRMAEAVRTTHAEILRLLAARGIGDVDATTRAMGDRIKEQLAQFVAAEENFSDATVEDRPLSTVLRELKVVLPSDVTREGAPLFLQACGPDALALGAAYMAQWNKLLICPGFLLQVLATGTMDSLTVVLAHEIGHSFGVNRPKFADSTAVYLGRHYEHFLMCVQRNYEKQFQNYDQVEGAMRARQRTYSALQGPARAQGAAASAEYDDFLASLEIRHDILDRALGSTYVVRPVKNYASELGANAAADVAIARLLRGKTAAQAWGLFAAQFQFACEERVGVPGVDDLLPALAPIEDDGFHPTFGYMLESAMRHPEVRRSIGCPASPTPYCGLDAD